MHVSVSLCLSCSETGGAVSGEPPRADRFRVPRAGGAGVQPAPARARGHAPLQTPSAGFLAAALGQESLGPLWPFWFPSHHLTSAPLDIPGFGPLPAVPMDTSYPHPTIDSRSAKGTCVYSLQYSFLRLFEEGRLPPLPTVSKAVTFFLRCFI